MATNSEGSSGRGTRRGGHCGGPDPVRPLAASDCDTDAARANYLEYVYACTHRDADANASTAYYLPDQHVYRDGSHSHLDGDPDGDDCANNGAEYQRTDRPAANALRRAPRATHGPSEE
jgi:hypothetical protein